LPFGQARVQARLTVLLLFCSVTTIKGVLTITPPGTSISATLMSGSACLLSNPTANGVQYVLEYKHSLTDQDWN
jgi:hypothetical protein